MKVLSIYIVHNSQGQLAILYFTDLGCMIYERDSLAFWRLHRIERQAAEKMISDTKKEM